MTDMELALATLRRALREESERPVLAADLTLGRMEKTQFIRGISHAIQILEAIRYGVEVKP